MSDVGICTVLSGKADSIPSRRYQGRDSALLPMRFLGLKDDTNLLHIVWRY